MSKRSYRRLAVVTGAALALGGMAPAMAALVDVQGNGTASVNATDLTNGLPSVSTLVPTALIGTVTDTALGTVQSTQTMALAQVNSLMAGIPGIISGLTSGGSLLSLNVAGNANASVNVLGASVAVNGLAAVPTTLVGTALDTATPLVGTALSTAGPLVDTGLGLANTAVGLAGTVPGTVLTTAGPLLTGGLGILSGGSVSGNVNVLASLMGAL